MANKTKPVWIVTLSGDRATREVTRDLEAAGLHVDQVLEPSNVITGTADPEAEEKLRKVRGVADVSPDSPVDIGPPGAEIS